MRHYRKAAVTIVIALALAGGWAWGGIDGSKHDFSNEAWAGGDMCGACHTPHRDQTPTATPLWDPKADLSRTFGTPITEVKGSGWGTRSCLQCHDGTIAKETLGGTARERLANRQHPSVFRAAHTRTDHPVSVDYPQFDKHFRPMTTVVARGSVVLPDGRIECVSCHDPHNDSDTKAMLVMENTRSALCLTCHKK